MKFAELISLLEKQVKLHASLYQLALKKTEALKNHDINVLTALMKDEQKHVLAIQQLEDKRLRITEHLLKDSEHERTITRCIELADEAERPKLEKLYEQLAELIINLKQANELNQQLTEQSLQFVYVTLDMLAPQTTPINYSSTSTYEEHADRSLFESKA
ncbi:FlgN protein [Anoxybacillus vitaminiphilus]|uniref:FlgN protein n=1 Tax=Paranoxybacillus vitaminiphilus TaxID=581036 RepID=A0A327YGA7_9BACL|nr:flagellar protein FlgN [Anoxybacillus vitaminiphilus]RAK19924.1 FlgN protein [Anoxybacillus vitaminiphilus]